MTTLSAGVVEVVRCSGCHEEHQVRQVWIVATWMLLCPGCYQHLQRGGIIPRNHSWDGTRQAS
jgi:formylmethanofuran dehydrogenase subunit E